MTFRVIPLEDLRQRDVMFWLPPGGQDNGVWATTWVALADLESVHVAPVLARLHDADIGGYVAKPSRAQAASGCSAVLYVDRDQHHRAVDTVMTYLRGTTAPPPIPARSRRHRRAFSRPVATAAKVAFIALVIAGGLVLAYYKGQQYLATVHHRHPHSASVPGITNGS